MVTYPSWADGKNELKIDGCNYKQSARKLTSWLETYGTIDSDFEKEAGVVDVEKDK